jgi:hypothetical protein
MKWLSYSQHRLTILIRDATDLIDCVTEEEQRQMNEKLSVGCFCQKTANGIILMPSMVIVFCCV